MNEKKVLQEITVAAFIGAAIGVVVGIVASAQFGLVQWASVLIGALAGTLMGGISYRPREIFTALIAIGRNLEMSSSKWRRLRKYRNRPLHNFLKSARAKIDRKIIAKICFWMILSVLFCISSRYSTGWLIAKDCVALGTFGLWFASSAVSFFTVALGGACLFLGFCTEEKPYQVSWKMPITIRIRRYFSRRLDKSINFEFTPVLLIMGSALAPFAIPLVWMIVVPIALVDAVFTAILSLASTERLASMTGALIGTLLGTIAFFSGVHHIAAIAIGAVLGGLSGKWLYLLRMALTFKDSCAQSA